nr:MAG TPA: holin [Bacteriophage sp.]
MNYNISAGTIARTVILFVTMANFILNYFGKNPLPFSNDEIYQGISAIAAILSAVAAWWKNNSFSHNAVSADAYLKEINQEK